MKKLILPLLFLTLINCSKDDEGETFLDKYDGTSWSIQEEVYTDGEFEEVADGGGVEVFTFSNGTYFYSQVVGGGPYPELLMIVISSKKVQMSYSDWR